MPSLTLQELAQLTGAQLDGDPGLQIEGPASLAEAGPHQVSFLTESKYKDQLASTRAGAVLVSLETNCERPEVALLRTTDPQQAFSLVVEAFAPPEAPPEPGVHPSAVVAEDAVLEQGCSIGPLVSVGAEAHIAAHAVLHARVVVGACATVGERTVLHPGVVLYPRVRVGSDCILHAGVVIGADGFGFEHRADGWVKIPQGGSVEIGDDVEIGANSTIDCARFGVTRIEDNVKIDNLVHVAHNCSLGRSAMLLAQSAVAGSTQVGRGAIIAGQAGVAGHLQIGDGARIGGKSGVFEDVPAGADYWGTPARPKIEAIKQYKGLRGLESLKAQLRELKRAIEDLEGRVP